MSTTPITTADQHIEASLAKIKVYFMEASARIEALKGTEKVPATRLAEEIASNHNLTGPSLYPILKVLFDGYPGVEISKGAHGGIRKTQPKTTVVADVAAPTIVVTP